jgi:hypothetical protein
MRSSTLTESSEAAGLVGIVEDIAALARRLAEQEPYKSAAGPEALLALAVHLDGMITDYRASEAPTHPGQPAVVRVAARRRRSDRG